MENPKFIKMPLPLHLWVRYVRKVPNTWVTTPLGICYPRTLDLDSELWTTADVGYLMVHEMEHYSRMTKLGKIRAWLWCLRYLVSGSFRYAEEVQAARKELTACSYQSRSARADWIATALIYDYGLSLTEADRDWILKDLTWGLPAQEV
jgi:hypothetical protein